MDIFCKVNKFLTNVQIKVSPPGFNLVSVAVVQRTLLVFVEGVAQGVGHAEAQVDG